MLAGAWPFCGGVGIDRQSELASLPRAFRDWAGSGHLPRVSRSGCLDAAGEAGRQRASGHIAANASN